MVEEYHRNHLDHIHVLNLLVINQMGDHHVLGMIVKEMTYEYSRLHN